jgi:hypothetical protein
MKISMAELTIIYRMQSLSLHGISMFFGLVWFGLVWFGLVWLLSPGQTRKHCCGNICDSRCFLKCFPVCPRVETLLPEKQKCFLANSEIFDVSLCFSLMFPSVCPL